MSEACLRQIRWWLNALKQSQKGHRRKNKYINRLERQNTDLEGKVAELQMTAAQLTAERELSGALMEALESIAKLSNNINYHEDDLQYDLSEAISTAQKTLAQYTEHRG